MQTICCRELNIKHNGCTASSCCWCMQEGTEYTVDIPGSSSRLHWCPSVNRMFSCYIVNGLISPLNISSSDIEEKNGVSVYIPYSSSLLGCQWTNTLVTIRWPLPTDGWHHLRNIEVTQANIHPTSPVRIPCYNQFSGLKDTQPGTTLIQLMYFISDTYKQWTLPSMWEERSFEDMEVPITLSQLAAEECRVLAGTSDAITS